METYDNVRASIVLQQCDFSMTEPDLHMRRPEPDAHAPATLEQRIAVLERRMSALEQRLNANGPADQYLVRFGEHAHSWINPDGGFGSGGIVAAPVSRGPVDIIR